jgi:hypothetical protein
MEEIRKQVLRTCRHLLSEQNRDPYSLAHGCFDRRYWGWKIVDFPEATFQRNVYPLSWLLKNPDQDFSSVGRDALFDSVQAGLSYTADIQHSNGSFDQAFPWEQSFGATAFLLHPLLEAYRTVEPDCAREFRGKIEGCLRRSAEFLCRHDEAHGRVSNHIAGAALSLFHCSDQFGDPRYQQRAWSLLEGLLEDQSKEGWFPEYGGADPGYQTLCLYYLAGIYRLRPDNRLREALVRAVEFLSWFAHPDGTFGGEYGSRRTAIFYPGGLAILAREISLGGNLLCFMLDSIAQGRTITLNDVDTANIAPLLETYLAVLDAGMPDPAEDNSPLPCRVNDTKRDFVEAGIFVRGTPRYYALLGVSNGGVLKVFDRRENKAIWNDSGYAGEASTGEFVTTQVTDLDRSARLAGEEIGLETDFCSLPRTSPTPFLFIILRLMNLTIMRSIRLGNWVKKRLVHLAMNKKRIVPLKLNRTVKFGTETVTVSDRIHGPLQLRWLEYGRPFVAIHMASARYYGGTGTATVWLPRRIDVIALHRSGELGCKVEM